MTDTWDLIAGERRALAAELDALTDDQWATPSLCAGWAVRDVVAHLVFPMRFGMVRLMGKLAARRFDFGRLADEEARGDPRGPDELVAALRANAEHRFHPPGFGPEAPLTDVIIHGQDIRRPLGLPCVIDEEPMRIALDLLTSPKAARGFIARGRLPGLRFEATDLGWSHGAGATVSGPAEALAMAIAGRACALDELEGEGVAVLRGRA